MLCDCTRCSTLYVPGVPDAEQGEDYEAWYGPAQLDIPEFVHGRLDEIVADFRPFRTTGRLLDVGFGAASLMEAAARAGWTPEGVEVSIRAVAHARSLGFEAFHGTLEEAAYPTGHFDVVAASELFEHVDDPQALATEMSRVLRPGSLLWATTPHGRGISARILGLDWHVVHPPQHLQLLSLRGAREMLHLGGFHDVQLATRGTNPYQLLHGRRPSSEVPSSRAVNERMRSTRGRRLLLRAANAGLRATRLGDSLKIRAIR